MGRNHITAFLILLISITPILNVSEYFLFRAEESAAETAKPNKDAQEKEHVSNDGLVHLENEMDMVELIDTVSEINQEVYIIDESVKPEKVNIITPDGGMKEEDFLKFFDVILHLNGLSVIKTDGVNKVMDSSRIKEENTPIFIDKSDKQ